MLLLCSGYGFFFLLHHHSFLCGVVVVFLFFRFFSSIRFVWFVRSFVCSRSRCVHLLGYGLFYAMMCVLGI